MKSLVHPGPYSLTGTATRRAFRRGVHPIGGKKRIISDGVVSMLEAIETHCVEMLCQSLWICPSVSASLGGTARSPPVTLVHLGFLAGFLLGGFFFTVCFFVGRRDFFRAIVLLLVSAYSRSPASSCRRRFVAKVREAQLDVGRIALDAKRQENFGSRALRGYAGLGHLSLPWSVRGNEPALGVFKHAGGVLFHEIRQQTGPS